MRLNIFLTMEDKSEKDAEEGKEEIQPWVDKPETNEASRSNIVADSLQNQGAEEVTKAIYGFIK